MARPLPPIPLDRWNALELSITAFPLEAAVASPQNWLRQLSGANESTLNRSSIGSVEQAAYNGRTLTLGIDVVRIYWALSPLLDAGNPDIMNGPPITGTFQETRAALDQLVGNWLRADCPPVKRLGFAGRVMLPATSREESYTYLGQFLKPHVQVDPDSFELLYRINRKRRSSVIAGGLTVNRLTTWGSIRFNMALQLNVSGGTSSTLASSPARSQTFDGCVVHFDINTDENHNERLPADRLVPLLQELSRYAEELVECGDVK
jgi:hypothetical protein